MMTESEVIELFCIADGFCKFFNGIMKKLYT
jgi:hypothetical protein